MKFDFLGIHPGSYKTPIKELITSELQPIIFHLDLFKHLLQNPSNTTTMPPKIDKHTRKEKEVQEAKARKRVYDRSVSGTGFGYV